MARRRRVPHRRLPAADRGRHRSPDEGQGRGCRGGVRTVCVEKAESAALRANLSVTPSTGASSDWASGSGDAGWGTTGRSSSGWGAGGSSSNWGSSASGESSPRAAVIEAWLSLEREIQRLAQAYDMKPGRSELSTWSSVDQLVSHGVISPHLAEVVAPELRRGRERRRPRGELQGRFARCRGVRRARGAVRPGPLRRAARATSRPRHLRRRRAHLATRRPPSAPARRPSPVRA